MNNQYVYHEPEKEADKDAKYSKNRRPSKGYQSVNQYIYPENRENMDKRTHQIVKSNDLIQTAAFSLTSLEYDLLNFIIMKIKPEDTDLLPQTISIKEYCKTAGISPEGNYTLIKGGLKSLADKSVWAVFYDKDGEKREKVVRWIEDPEICPGKGEITVQLKPYWKPYLTNLTERFTVLTLQETMPMKSVYGKRLYELLKSHTMNRKGDVIITFEIDELRRKMFGNDKAKTKYTDLSNFKKRVLSPAMKDLSIYGDISVSYKMRRDGRTYKYIDFIVKMKSITERMTAYEEEEKAFHEK